MKRDYSKYSLSEIEKYERDHSLSGDARLDFFHNSVRFDEHSHSFIISVDPSYEICFSSRIIKDHKYEAKEYASQKHLDSQHHDLNARPSPNDPYIKVVVEQQEKLIQQLNEKYPGVIDRSFIEKSFADYYAELDDPIDAYQPYNKELLNVLSGSTISLNCGEGILDFLYTDLELAFKPLFDTIDFEDLPFGDPARSSEKTEHIVNSFHDFIKDLDDYRFCSAKLHHALYSSLYTAICPPLLRNRTAMIYDIFAYKEYLETLQQEYTRMLEVCFDENYYPAITKNLSPATRFWVYKHSIDLPAAFSRKETLSFSDAEDGAFSLSPEAFLKGKIPGTSYEEAVEYGYLEHEDDYVDLAGDLFLDTEELLSLLRIPKNVTVGYPFSKIDEIMSLEFSKMIEYGIRVRKCKRCGKYFIMKGNYDTNYCDRVANGETKTCQELAAMENYKAKIADNKAIPIYNKYYKRYAARVKVNQIKEADFRAWKYEALTKRDACTAGEITPEEYTDWMEAAFPNRKRKK